VSIELFLSIASFALSFGGLIPALFGIPTRSRVVIAIIFTALISITGTVLYRDYSHDTLVNQVMDEIVNKIGDNVWTYDQIHEAVLYQPPEITRKSLFRLVSEDKIGDKQETFIKDGAEWKVRAYYLK